MMAWEQFLEEWPEKELILKVSEASKLSGRESIEPPEYHEVSPPKVANHINRNRIKEEVAVVCKVWHVTEKKEKGTYDQIFKAVFKIYDQRF